MTLNSPVARSVLPTLSQEFYAPFSFRFLVAALVVFSYYVKRAGRPALQLSLDVDYSAELWMLKILNSRPVKQFFDALPYLMALI